MKLKKYKLGELIELVVETNSDELFGPDDVRGISNLKKMMSTKADLNGRDLSKFQIVRPGTFVFNHRTSRNGSKFSITYNYDSVPHIFTEDYVVFRIKKDCENILLKEWLYMYFCRAEFDRFVITNSWGSSTEFYNWEDLCDIDITLPSIEQQRKYVDVYLALQNNLAVYQSKADELKLVCDGYIEELRRKMKCQKIGDYLQEEILRNTDNLLGKEDVLGVTKDKTYIKTVANLNGIDLSNYKVVKPRQFAYSNRINIGSIALRYDTPCLVSPSYTVFSVNEAKILSEYLLLWLSRSEFLHYAFFYSMGTVKDEMDVDDIGNMEIPIPDIKVQQEIVNIHKCYIERQRIADALKEQINNICPVLIRGSLTE